YIDSRYDVAGSQIQLRLRAAGTPVTAMTLTGSGNIGIGTTSPMSRLSVSGGDIVLWEGTTQRDLKVFNGAICADNNGGTKCQAALTAGTVYGDASSFAASDVAELYLATEELEPGDIAMFDQGEPVHIKKAVQQSDVLLAGAISTKPGVLLGDAVTSSSTHAYPVALSGRIPAKVNLEGGDISIGDPITISSIPGVGKKATQTTKIIGYALEPYNETLNADNKIMVFANLTYYTSTDPVEAFVDANGASNSSLITLALEAFKSWLSSMQITIENGLVTLKNLVAEKITASILDVIKLKVGTSEQPAGITVYDKNTKQPYCVIVIDGQLQNIAGECASEVEQATEQSVEQTTEEIAEQPVEQTTEEQPSEEQPPVSDPVEASDANGASSDSATTTPEAL
ncbi:MAG: hypothetical protein HZB99_03075, partial [Candidatus Harrisonbacteria bacterium]|nr:hypothetical protein [Candidatus Harrisonbacteria bacterium]